jgi:hypothetical protein
MRMQRLVMQPYPSHLIQRLTLGDGTAVTILTWCGS